MNKKALLRSALQILAALGFPQAQQNERSALILAGFAESPTQEGLAAG